MSMYTDSVVMYVVCAHLCLLFSKYIYVHSLYINSKQQYILIVHLDIAWEKGTVSTEPYLCGTFVTSGIGVGAIPAGQAMA